ncbi:unnamed protein product, partial [Prorocentrum cordatum]
MGRDGSDAEGPPARHRVTVDLPAAVLGMIGFLSEVDECPSLYLNQDVLAEAVRRYERLWLPLVAGLEPALQRALVPPLDVEWAWHCHMLAPLAYRRDVSQVLARAGGQAAAAGVDHAVLTGSARTDGLSRARALWEEAHPGEAFDVREALARAPLRAERGGQPRGLPSSISYDIAGAAGRQMAFHYQVAVLPHYRDAQFLREAADRYAGRYLELQRRRPEGFWVPSYDIDACWHAHMLHPARYAADTISLCGKVVPHDDSVNDRAEGSKLRRAWQETQQAWKEEFGDGPFAAGGMFRGSPSEEELQAGLGWQPPRVSGAELRAAAVQDEPGEACLVGAKSLHSAEFVDAACGVGASSLSSTVERLRWLTPTGDTALHARTVHWAAGQRRGRPPSRGSFCELRAPSAGAAAGGPPVATAHQVWECQLPSPGQLADPTASATLDCGSGEAAFLLRAAGRDLAVVSGRWRGGSRKGCRGELQAFLTMLQGPEYGKRLELASASPMGVSTFDLPALGGARACCAAAGCQVTAGGGGALLPAALVAHALAMLRAQVQPHSGADARFLWAHSPACTGRGKFLSAAGGPALSAACLAVALGLLAVGAAAGAAAGLLAPPRLAGGRPAGGGDAEAVLAAPRMLQEAEVDVGLIIGGSFVVGVLGLKCYCCLRKKWCAGGGGGGGGRGGGGSGGSGGGGGVWGFGGGCGGGA